MNNDKKIIIKWWFLTGKRMETSLNKYVMIFCQVKVNREGNKKYTGGIIIIHSIVEDHLSLSPPAEEGSKIENKLVIMIRVNIK